MSRTEYFFTSLSFVFIHHHFLVYLFFSLFPQLLLLVFSSVASGVPVIVGHLNELVHHVQQVVVVFLQQALVQRPIPKAHLHQHGHHGVLGGCVHRRLQGYNIGWVNEICYLLYHKKYVCNVHGALLRIIICIERSESLFFYTFLTKKYICWI